MHTPCSSIKSHHEKDHRQEHAEMLPVLKQHLSLSIMYMSTFTYVQRNWVISCMLSAGLTAHYVLYRVLQVPKSFHSSFISCSLVKVDSSLQPCLFRWS